MLEHVRQSDVLVLFQTSGVLLRPYVMQPLSPPSRPVSRPPSNTHPPRFVAFSLPPHSLPTAPSALRSLPCAATSYCILEVNAAIEAGVPIVALLVRGQGYGEIPLHHPIHPLATPITPTCCCVRAVQTSKPP